MNERLDELGEWLGVAWSDQQRDQLERFERWLGEEAVIAGGIGPDEVTRLFDRHIADSLAFLSQFDDRVERLADVGSGVGLPGIPIAIALPGTSVLLIDRAERRTRLARRAIRILGMENVDVHTGDARKIEDVLDVVVFRASLRVEAAIEAFDALAAPEGLGVMAWSRLDTPRSPPLAPDRTILSLVSEGHRVLDSPAWFLRMRRSQQT